MDDSFQELMNQLAESTKAHQAALNELRQVLLSRGLITLEGLAAARAEMEAPHA